MASKHPLNSQSTVNVSLPTEPKPDSYGTSVVDKCKDKDRNRDSDADGEEEIIVPEDPADDDVAYVEGNVLLEKATFVIDMVVLAVFILLSIYGVCAFRAGR